MHEKFLPRLIGNVGKSRGIGFMFLLALFLSWNFGHSQVGTTCENPIVVTALPYTTTDNTANYADNYDPQTTTSPACAPSTNGNNYHSGNDVIYAYTPATDTSIDIEIPAAIGWTGMFVYSDCADIGVEYAACAVGSSAGPRTISNFTVIGGQTYYILISSYATPQTVAYTLNITENTCISHAVTYTLVSDCANAPQFFVTANITSMGSATSINVTDNQGSPAQVVTATGQLSFGPYANGTSVVITAANVTDGSCVVTSATLNQAACPPANDNCSGAIALTVNPDFNCGTVTAGSTLGATESIAAGVCNGNPDDDVWFSFVATQTSHLIQLSDIVAVSGTGTDMYFQVLSGTCGATTSVLCSDPNSNTVTGLTVGSTYYVRVYNYSNSSRNTFNICIGSMPGAPANDDCSGAVNLTVNADLACGNVAQGTTAGATQSMAAEPCNGTPDDDVWYSFVATSTAHQVKLTNVSAVVGSGTDMYFQVLSGNCGAGTSMLCSDPETATINGFTVGETYFIRVYSYSATSRNNFTICIGTPPPAPANDECSGAVALTVNPDLACGTVTQGTTADAFQSMAATPCGGTPDDDVWYSFVATSTAHQVKIADVVAVTGSSTDMYFQVLSGNCGAGTSIICSDDNTASFGGLTVGDTYFIRVYNYGSTSRNTFSICVGTPPPGPANDECSGAIALTVNPDLACGTVTQGSTVDAVQSMAATPCSGAPDDDVWFSFVATGVSHEIKLSNIAAVTGTSTDMYFQVMSGNCGALTSLLCSDPNSGVVSGLTVGNTYFIRVYSYGSARNTFDICVGTVPQPPANDNCADAVALTVNADLACGSVTQGTTLGATLSAAAGACNGNPDDDVWYSFTATNTSHQIKLTGISAVSGSGTDMYFQVMSGNCAGTTSLLCSDPETNLVTGLTVGTTYLIRVYSYATSYNNFTICVGTPPPPPANDACSAAIALAVGTDFDSSNIVTSNVSGSNNAADPLPSCDSVGFASAGKDIWFTVTVPANGTVILETRSNDDTGVTDTGLAVYSGACGTLTSLGCSADDGEGNFSLLELTGQTPGAVLIVRTWGYNGTAGSFKIAAYTECDLDAPEGDEEQTLEPGQTLADLDVTGTNLTWYSDEALTAVIPATTVAVDGTTYYVTQTEAPCVSDALAIEVAVVDPCAGTLAPTGDEEQTLAPGQTLADLDVTGEDLTWYSDEALTSEIPATTVAVDGTTYYVTQTLGECTSDALAIEVAVVDPCAGILAPTGDEEQTLAPGQTLADLDVTGEDLTWYSDEALTSEIPATTVAVDGTTYYVTQTVGECTSEALAIEVAVVDPCAGILAPTGDEEQTLAPGQTLADLDVTGEDLTWYSDEALTSEIPATTVAVDGTTYYVTQTVGECTSEALAIEVAVVDPCAGILAPTGASEQVLEPGQTLADLDVTGENLTWYADEALTTEIPATTVAVNETVYYVTQTIGECTSEALAIEVEFPDPCEGLEEPAGEDEQEYAPGETLADLDVIGENLTWYADEELTTVLPETTPLVDGTTYYVTQTVGECTSDALDVTVEEVLGRDGFDNASFRYYPNPVSDVLTLSHASEISSVTVFNMLGQPVLEAAPKATGYTLDLSHLQSGSYLVKVSAGDAVKTVKIVKN